jgi:hypothetical protein
MNFKTFTEYFLQVSANMARNIAQANGVSTTQCDLWIAQLSKGGAK